MKARTQKADVDRLYQEWLEAAKNGPIGGTPKITALWERFAKADDEVNGKIQGWHYVHS